MIQSSQQQLVGVVHLVTQQCSKMNFTMEANSAVLRDIHASQSRTEWRQLVEKQQVRSFYARRSACLIKSLLLMVHESWSSP